MFVNRSTELDALQRWWRKRTARAGMVWGRRRVGKTALLRQFARDFPSVFHTGAGRPREIELAALAQTVIALDRGGIRDLATRPFTDWDDALDYLADIAVREPLLVVLDEFSELAATSPELPNVLRAFLDRVEGRTKLRLLLCGSAVRYMQALVEERQPLYGRMDMTLPVHPFEPSEAALMLPKLSPADRAVVYGLVGGIPLYLSWWEQGQSIKDNIRELACEPGGRMLTEGDLILATEVEAGEYPKAVLHAIAGGRTRHNEIEAIIRADPTRTLERLITLRLVDRVQPVTEAGRTRRRIYRIADNFLSFYLDVLARYRSEIDAGFGPGILPVLMDSIDDHMGIPWEAAFRRHLRLLAIRGEIGEQIVAIGPFWTTDGKVEIDAVALSGRSRTPVLVGEAKWRRRVDGGRLAAELRRKAENVPKASTDIAIALAARDAIDNAPAGTREITSVDIFGG